MNISSVFDQGKKIPEIYTCDGEDKIPPLTITNVPASAQSLVLIVEDPDAPRGTWDHWVVWNIDPKTAKIAEGIAPKATYGKNSAGTLEWHGPCPPDGEHRYFFKLYALDTRLDLPQGSSKRELLEVMEGHIIEKAQVVGRYGRITL